jgi:hypothetical protein
MQMAGVTKAGTVLLSIALLLTGCNTSGAKRVDAKKVGLVPKEAPLMSENHDAKVPIDPIGFIAPEPGQVFLVGNNERLTRFPVDRGDRVEFAMPVGFGEEKVAMVMRNEKTLLKRQGMPIHRAFYFMGAGQTN